MDFPKRVLYFSRNFSTHDIRFLTSLADTEYDVYFLRLENQKSNLRVDVLPSKIKVLPPLNKNQEFTFLNIPGNAIDLRNIIKQITPDIIHAGPIQSCGFLAALAGFSPLVTMSWGSDILVDSERNIFLKWITKYTLKKTAILIGDCEAVKNKVIQFNFSENRIVLFPWGIDLQKYQPGKNEEYRKKLGWLDKFVLLSLRSWERIYGVDIVVNGFIEAIKSEPDLRLILLGNGSQTEIIKSIIKEAGLSDRVFFGGVVDQNDLPGYYQASDLYISASYSDGSSVSLMEALACGIPVLVSDIPGNKEWIETDKNGWMFQSGDYLSLANSIIKICKNKKDLPSISLKARKTAERKANWNENFQKNQHAYELALNLNHNREEISGLT
ncbi:MAG: glycosyltransferase [Anaerolineaceae bacterium]|nr:glycosyltransferase [Anaerolineaceae bacterium]